MSELDRATMADVSQREWDKLHAEIERLTAENTYMLDTRLGLVQEIERLREALRAAGINLITASNTIERLGDLQDAEATRRMAKQILPLVNEQKTTPGNVK